MLQMLRLTPGVYFYGRGVFLPPSLSGLIWVLVVAAFTERSLVGVELLVTAQRSAQGKRANLLVPVGIAFALAALARFVPWRLLARKCGG